MKKFSWLMICLAFTSLATAQDGGLKISGNTGGQNNKPLYISNFAGSEAKVALNTDGSFTFSSAELEKGFYDMGIIGTVYLKPGFNLHVKPAKGGKTFEFSGTGAFENNVLRTANAQYGNFIPVDDKGNLSQKAIYMDPPEFIKQTEAFVRNGEKLFSKSDDKFFRENALGDLSFFARKMMQSYRNGYGKDIEKTREMSRYLMTADRKAPDFQEKLDALVKPSIVKTMDSAHIKQIEYILWEDWGKENEELFRQSFYYRNFVNMYVSTRVLEQMDPEKVADNVEREEVRAAVIKKELRNAYIRDYFYYSSIMNILKTAKDRKRLDKYHTEFMSTSTDEKRRRKVDEVYHSTTTYVNGADAPNFTYEDVSGKKISLESFRGKYVYIDVWATWCGPCKAEIPHLKKVEADYHGKNIAFVSISVDKEHDREKWRQYVKENSLGGTQLITVNGTGEDFVENMSVLTIPRFILIDPAGKILLKVAPRPSEPEIRSVFDKILDGEHALAY